MPPLVRKIPERVVPGKRLGRNLEHDPRSWNFRHEGAAALVSRRHRHHGQILDQGKLGSCTGHGLVDALMTSPDRGKLTKPLGEIDALDAYELATKLDNIPGAYPPDDTGSSGLAVCKAGVQLGWISRYEHTFSLDELLHALVLRPVIVGVNWYAGFDTPDRRGFVSIGGDVRGGHEFALVGLNVSAQRVTALNSWGPSWGAGGFFTFSWNDLERLLGEHGDCTVPIP